MWLWSLVSLKSVGQACRLETQQGVDVAVLDEGSLEQNSFSQDTSVFSLKDLN